MLGLGAFPTDHELSLGMLGMHGTVYANKAVLDCDLILSIGSRWDDRITGKLEVFCKDAIKMHIDIDPAEEGKVLQPDVFMCGDAKLVLEQPPPEWCTSSIPPTGSRLARPGRSASRSPTPSRADSACST
jgi:Thiamine pyrophosphate-requiring enzymes [acetolactate synthase, pyruvate dehydrogenase (cytochrome), glyoxylate carboligase, phosphonopyruvate decarboxylase]